MKGYTEVPITIDLPFEHCCKACGNFCLEYRADFKEVPFRKILSDVIHGKKVVLQIPQTIIPNYCDKHKKQVDPAAKEPCFIWTGSHEEWIPYIRASIVDGKVKVKFG